MPKRTYAMRYVAGQPVERIFPGAVNQPLPPAALPTTGALRVMVWNIFKQQRADWLSVLKNHGKDAQLVLLQEAQTTPELVSYATANYLAADQVPAFVLPQHPSGVMTLAAAHPVYCCPLREREPLLRLSKSALITVYPLYNGELLMVVNIHAVNFSLGVDVYSKQLGPIGEQIASHRGPVIMAGTSTPGAVNVSMRCMTLPAKWRCVRLASPTITAARPLAVRWTSCFTVTRGSWRRRCW